MKWLQWSEWCAGNNGETELLRARANRKLGRWDDVRNHLLQARALGAPATDIQREDWMAKAQSGQLEDVEIRRNQMLLDPQGDTEEICEAFVLGYLLNRRFHDAIQILEPWSADYPDTAQPHYLLGLTYAENDKLAPSVKSLRRALELEPDYMQARLALAKALLTMNNGKDALPEFRACAKIQETGEVDCGIAQSLLSLGEFTEARAVLESAIVRFPDNFCLHLTLGKFLMDDQMQVAFLHLEKAVKLQSRNIDARYSFAQILLRLRSSDEAQVHLDYVQAANVALARMQKDLDTIQSEPANVEIRCRIGLTQLKYGTERQGVEWLQTVLNYDPGNKDANQALAEYYEARASESSVFSELAARYRQAFRKETR